MVGLRIKHQVLVRNAVKAVGQLQHVCDDENTPEHVKPYLEIALLMLDRGLIGKAMEDERVVIEVLGGVAYVASKTDYVDVIIHDLDSEEG